MRYFIILIAVLVLAGCGGKSTPEVQQPEPLKDARSVETMIAANDEIVLRLSQSFDYTVSCVSEDAEGRFFQCLGEIRAPATGQRIIAHSFEVTCDATNCQWMRYDTT